MLEDARKKGASVFVYIIFCVLIVVFVINFGPQGGQGGGCNDSANVVMSVAGEETTQSSYHIAYANPYNRGTGRQHAYVALETLIRRELLAQEAIKRGLRATDDMVMEEIKRGYFFLGGQRAQIPGIFDENGLWNRNAFRNWVGQLNVSRNSYIQEQQRGMLAAMMSQILEDSVQVSRDEALQQYLFQNNTVTYDVVAFRPDAYRSAFKLTDADVDRFLASHGGEVEARYKTDERTYKGVKPQLQLRQIFIATQSPAPAPAPAPAPDQGSAAGSAAAGSAAPTGAGAGSAVATPEAKKDAPKVEAKAEPKKDDKKPAMKVEEAKAKLEAIRTAAEKDKQKFVDAAKTLNSDDAMKNSAGDLGWRTADQPMLGDKAVTDAVKDLKAGEMTPVITTDKGVYLVRAEARREGDLTFEQVKHEIAKELARDVWSKEAAKRAALAALDKARSGTGVNLSQLYEQEQSPAGPGIDIQQILNDPNIPQEQKQRIIEMMLKQGGEQGSLVVESDDVPAGWKAQADGAGGGSAAAGSAAKPAVPAAGSAAPTATGSAAPAAAGSAAPAGATPAAPAAPVVEAPLTPSTDKLPELGEIKKPTVRRYGPAPRESVMQGLGSSKAAATALFEELEAGMLAKQVYEGDGNYLVIQLIAKSQPKVEDFERDADRMVEELRASRAQQFVEDWMQERCEQLLKDNKIKPNPGLIRESDDKGNPMPTVYRPCMSFQ